MAPSPAWRRRRDSNSRAVAGKLISSFIKCVSGSVSFVSGSASFVLGAKPQKHWIFHAEAPKKPNIPGKFECVGKCAKIRIFGKNCRASGTCSDEAIHGQSYWQIGF